MHSSVSTFSLKHIGEVSNKLAEHAVNVEADGRWPKASLEICRDEGVFRWFLPNEFEGWAWTEEQIFRGYLGISQSCLTTAFIITQWQAAVRRILATSNKSLRSRIGRGLSDGSCFVTVGISQLTTSRQHTKPPLMATRVEGGYLLTGYAPWVTGASYADLLVLGAVTDIGEQILLAVETRDKGIRCRPGMSLVALTASCTDQVDLEGAFVPDAQILNGPKGNVLLASTDEGRSHVAGAGGVQTSILAIGHAMAAVKFLKSESRVRSSLKSIADKISDDVEELIDLTSRLTLGEPCVTPTTLRSRANSLVLRATQAALQAAKGAGFVRGHSTGRWAKEALFFLVWSCPQAVIDANLCEFAGIVGPVD